MTEFGSDSRVIAATQGGKLINYSGSANIRDRCMPGGPVSSQGLKLQHSLHFWRSGLHMRTRVPQIRPSSSGSTAGDTTNRERLGGGKIWGGWFNAWTHKITSKKMRDPSVLVISPLTKAKGMEGILKSNPKTQKKGMRPFHEVKKDKKAQRKTWRKWEETESRVVKERPIE